jgi:hypothetical protein
MDETERNYRPSMPQASLVLTGSRETAIIVSILQRYI